MKRFAAAALIAGLGAGTASAEVVLLGGFDGVNNAAIQSPTLTGSGVDVTLSSVINGVASDATNGFSQINTSNWGTTTLDVAAPTIGDGDDNRRAIVQSRTGSIVENVNTFTPWSVILTIANNSTEDLILDQIHYNLKKDTSNEGPNGSQLTYTSGDLDDANGTNTGNIAIPNGVNGFDVDLSGFLTDTTLAAGEEAVFTFTHNEPQDYGGNTGLRIDNFAISGQLVPEPGSLALLGLGGLLVARRRRG